METNKLSMLLQYYDLKKKHPDAILLFRVDDFYETFCEDAADVARILGITLVSRKSEGQNGEEVKIPLAGFPHYALDIYLHRLVRAGRKVAICGE